MSLGGGVVPLFDCLRLLVHNERHAYSWMSSRVAEQAADTLLTRLALRSPPDGTWTWRLCIQAQCGSVRLPDVEAIIPHRKAARIRSLVIQGLLGQAVDSAVSHRQARELQDLARQLQGKPAIGGVGTVPHDPRGSGGRVMPGVPPVGIHAVRLRTDDDAWSGQGDGVEREATRVLREWVRRPGSGSWRRDIQFELTLDGDRVVRIQRTFVEAPDVDGLRTVVIQGLRERTEDDELTSSVREVLGHLADGLAGRPHDFSQEPPTHWAGGGSHRAKCTCGQHAPWRWAYLAGYRVRVPAMHPPRRGPTGRHGMCRRAEKNHKHLDPVPPWTLEEDAPNPVKPLDRETWWHLVLRDLPTGLPREGAS